MTAHNPHIEQGDEIAIRRLGADDMSTLKQLAERDSTVEPDGRLLGALVDGRLVAAISLDSGDSVADPFSHSAGARALLAERASQLRGRGRGLLRWRRPHARGALGASPPGAGGRLLRLS